MARAAAIRAHRPGAVQTPPARSATARSDAAAAGDSATAEIDLVADQPGQVGGRGTDLARNQRGDAREGRVDLRAQAAPDLVHRDSDLVTGDLADLAAQLVGDDLHLTPRRGRRRLIQPRAKGGHRVVNRDVDAVLQPLLDLAKAPVKARSLL